ncbi:MAG: hypothetical protein JW737_09385 [Acidobacteria bacterium]|nr:hypothetical protein [Acidobacteriota bacterium]
MITNSDNGTIEDPFDVVKNELQKIKGSISDIKGMLLVDEDGMTVVSVMDNEEHEEIWAAAGTQMIEIAENLINDLKWDEIEQCIIKTKEKLFVIQKCNPNLLLICEGSTKANLAMLFMQLKRINRVVQKSLG